MFEHTEISSLNNIIVNGSRLEIVTKGRFTFLIKLIHYFKKKKVKRYMKYLYKYNRYNIDTNERRTRGGKC